MKICLVGHGFVGSAVRKKLEVKYDLTVIASSKSVFEPEYFDLIINCAGVSKKYEVERDFDAAWDHEKAIFDSIQDIQIINPKVKLLHISSICATEDTNYGEIKRITERQATRFDYCILRLGGLVGEGLSKNVVFDWINEKSIHISIESEYNFISTEEVANIIDHIIDNWCQLITSSSGNKTERPQAPFRGQPSPLNEPNWKLNKIINIGALKPILIRDLFSLREFNLHLIVDSKKIVENYNFDVSELQKFYPTKTSREYIEEYLESLNL